MFGVLVMCLGLFSDELQVELKMSRFFGSVHLAFRIRSQKVLRMETAPCRGSSLDS
jgi:hypothetical protein